MSRNKLFVNQMNHFLAVCGNRKYIFYRSCRFPSVISNVIESFVRDDVVLRMVENRLFAKEQNGFVPVRNCVTQLLETLEAWSQIREDGGCIAIIYTAFS